jgi:tetratricopeptide (TPR) repeat protein
MRASDGGWHPARPTVGHALLGFLVVSVVSGCSGSDGVRPVIAMGGETIAMEDSVEAGRALVLTGQYGLAIEALTDATRTAPGNARALTLLAVAYDRVHRPDLADRYYQRALDDDPHFVAALNNWGYSYLRRGNYAKAESLLKLAQDERANDPVIEANLRLLPGHADQAQPAELEPQAAAQAPVIHHIALVKRRNAIVRTAPDVQTLVTRPAPKPDRSG